MEFKIGEKMSEVVAQDATYYEHQGDLYKDEVHFLMNKPLDTGRLLFAKLREAMDTSIGVEVIYDHFSNTITAHMQGRHRELETSFVDAHMPRAEKLAEVARIIEGAKGAEPFLLS